MLRTGQSARAEPIARQLQLAYPHRGDVNHMMALILSNLGRPEQAEPYHARAVSADGRNTSYLLNYGLCLLRMGRVSEAAKHYERAAALEPSNPIVTWRIGSFHFELGQGEKALRAVPEGTCRGARKAPGRQFIWKWSIAFCRWGEAKRRKTRSGSRSTPRRSGAATSPCCPASASPEPTRRSSQWWKTSCKQPKLHPQERSALLLRKAVMLDNSKRYDEAFETTLASKRLLSPAPPKADFGGAT